MPYDPPPDGDQPMLVSCLVVGGCANGVLLPGIEVTAQFIELKRPAYIKPIASALQKVPEIANESDEYEIHMFGLTDTGTLNPALIALAVVKGRSLTWAFKQMVASYCEKTVNDLRAAGISPPGTKTRKKSH